MVVFWISWDCSFAGVYCHKNKFLLMTDSDTTTPRALKAPKATSLFASVPATGRQLILLVVLLFVL